METAVDAALHYFMLFIACEYKCSEWYEDGIDNTIENSSIFSLISSWWGCWLTQVDLYTTATTTTAAAAAAAATNTTILQPLYKTVCISRHLS